MQNRCVSSAHAKQFTAFYKHWKGKFQLDDILDGIAKWPRDARDRDGLNFLAQSLRGRLVDELPECKEAAGEEHRAIQSASQLPLDCDERDQAGRTLHQRATA